MPRHFVVRKDVATNTVFVAAGTNHPALFSHSVIVKDILWRVDHRKSSFACLCRVRHLQPLCECTVRILSGGNEVVARVDFAEPQRGFAEMQVLCYGFLPSTRKTLYAQVAVFYGPPQSAGSEQGRQVLGAGYICEAVIAS